MNERVTPSIRVAMAPMLLVTVLGTCAPSIQVETLTTPDHTVEAGQTYSWIGGSGGVQGDLLTTDNPSLDRLIRDVVDEALAARGFAKVEEGEADLGLAYVAAVERELRVEEVNDILRYRRGTYLVSRTDVEEFQRGSLVLDFTDSTGRLVWRGAAEAELHSEDRDYREGRLRDAVGRLADELLSSTGR